MSSIYPSVDPDGLAEFSVVFTDRSLNHMSQRFQGVMRGLSDGLKGVYGAHSIALVPGGGTFAMEAVARQFARERGVLVVRNGWFSYRWSQIFDTGVGVEQVEVAMASPDDATPRQQFSPCPASEVAERIRALRPDCVIAPHVETSAGMLLDDDYLQTLSSAAHEVGALMVLDCVASGCLWVDMAALGIDVLISASQKGWSSTPCAGMVLMSERASDRLSETESDSFALNLRTWRNIMASYEAGGHSYHATLPTDGLDALYRTFLECERIGFPLLRERQWELGRAVRDLLAEEGFRSLAAAGFEAPSVVVLHTERDDFSNGSAFARTGTQIAAGVPLRCGESDAFRTFRIGLFGLDKLLDPGGTLERFRAGLGRALAA